jgi:hypothetical protein
MRSVSEADGSAGSGLSGNRCRARALIGNAQALSKTLDPDVNATSTTRFA